jgi:hypothetical protein
MPWKARVSNSAPTLMLVMNIETNGAIDFEGDPQCGAYPGRSSPTLEGMPVSQKVLRPRLT